MSLLNNFSLANSCVLLPCACILPFRHIKLSSHFPYKSICICEIYRLHNPSHTQKVSTHVQVLFFCSNTHCSNCFSRDSIWCLLYEALYVSMDDPVWLQCYHTKTVPEETSYGIHLRSIFVAERTRQNTEQSQHKSLIYQSDFTSQ